MRPDYHRVIVDPGPLDDYAVALERARQAEQDAATRRAADGEDRLRNQARPYDGERGRRQARRLLDSRPTSVGCSCDCMSCAHGQHCCSCRTQRTRGGQ